MITFNKTFSIWLILIVIIFLASTYVKNMVWKDEIILWKNVAKKSINKSRGYNNIGKVYSEKGFTDKAIENFLIAIKIDPDCPDAHYNIGLAYFYS